MFDYQVYFQFILALAAVIFMIGGTAWLLKQLQKRMGMRLHGGKRRLSLVEVLPLDTKRRLVLVRRDDREHLVIIGGEHDLIVERDIGQDPATGMAFSSHLVSEPEQKAQP